MRGAARARFSGPKRNPKSLTLMDHTIWDYWIINVCQTSNPAILTSQRKRKEFELPKLYLLEGLTSDGYDDN